MNVLFLSILGINNINERGLYNDLMRTFRDRGHAVYITCPTERRNREKTSLKIESSINILSIKTLNFQKTNTIEKGLSAILMEYQFYYAIKRYFKGVRFDLIVYSTPPITFTKVVRFIKGRDRAFAYLLLKDIFPQNAVDLGMLKLNGMLYEYFRKKERKLYAISDKIGCMSPANVKFILDHNKDIAPKTVEVNPNSIIPLVNLINDQRKIDVRKKYNLPVGVPIFIYGGNLGKPQGVGFLLEVLISNVDNMNVFFLIVGSGTEFNTLKKWFDDNKPKNSILLNGLSKEAYDELLQASDVGLIFLDKRFTIPNFPSRLLSYLECEMPILAATDVNTDIGYLAEANGFGFWCESGDLDSFNVHLKRLTSKPLLISTMGLNGHRFLMNNYTSEKSYEIIMSHFESKCRC